MTTISRQPSKSISRVPFLVFGAAGALLIAGFTLVALSAVVVSHPPPIGPFGLACFAGAVLVLYRSQRAGATSTPQRRRRAVINHERESMTTPRSSL